MNTRQLLRIGALLIASMSLAAETDWTIERLVLESPWGHFPVGTAIVFEINQVGAPPGTMTQVLRRNAKGDLEIVAVSGQAKKTQPVVKIRSAQIEDTGTDSVSIDGVAMPCNKKRVTFEGGTLEVCLHEEHGVLRIDKESHPATTVVALAEPCSIGEAIQLTCRRLNVGPSSTLMSLEVPSGVVHSEQKAGEYTSTMIATRVEYGQPDLCQPLRQVADEFLQEKTAAPHTELRLQGASRSYLETRTGKDGTQVERFVAEFTSFGAVAPARKRYEQAFAALRACNEFSWTDEQTVDDQCRRLAGRRGQAQGPVELRVQTCFRSSGQAATEQVLQVSLE